MRATKPTRTFREVVDALVKATWTTPLSPGSGHQTAILRAEQSLTVTRLMDLAANANAQPQVRATATEVSARTTKDAQTNRPDRRYRRAQ
ncbi:MAG: hypothetical protein WKF71_10190 [Pyrinomonadaceae bacterium]